MLWWSKIKFIFPLYIKVGMKAAKSYKANVAGRLYTVNQHWISSVSISPHTFFKTLR